MRLRPSGINQARILRGFAVALILLVLIVSPASAHAILLRSDPPDLCLTTFVSESVCDSGQLLTSPPQVIHLWFSEPVQPFAGGVTVSGPSGTIVRNDGVDIEGAELRVAVDASEPGTYVVTWRVIAADTHPARGKFAFSVGHASATTSVRSETSIGEVSALGLLLQVAARWFHFVGFTLAFGVLAFRVIVMDRGRVTHQFVTIEGSDRGSAKLRSVSVQERVGRLIGVGLACLLAAEPLALLGQTASLGASSMLDPAMVSGALDSSFGRVLALRLGAALGLWVLLGMEKDGTLVAPLAAAAGVLLAFIDGASAHAASMTPVWLGYTVNAVHLLAAALWLGGIVSLVALWRVDDLRDVRGTLLRRFSPLAAGALFLIACSGVLMAWTHRALPIIGTFGTYTIAALMKVALLICAGALAAIALRRTGVNRERWWLAEAAVLALAMLVAGVLASLPPPA